MSIVEQLSFGFTAEAIWSLLVDLKGRYSVTGNREKTLKETVASAHAQWGVLHPAPQILKKYKVHRNN